MEPLETAVHVEGQGRGCQDRAEVFTRGRLVVAVVADGAGGMSGGAAAASMAVEHVRRAVHGDRNLMNLAVCKQLLLELDAELAAQSVGLTTAVVVATDGGRLAGASVGDSGAWLIGPKGIKDLTALQARKPLLGEGSANPGGISGEMRRSECLLLATDGLFKFAKREDICAAVRRRLALGECSEQLTALVRLPSGALQDDVGMALLRYPLRALEERLVSSARAWREALVGPSGNDSHEAERRFADDLQEWVASQLPDEERWRGRWYDGLEVDSYSFDDEAQVRLCGWVWRLEPQARYPFEARLVLEGNTLSGFDVLFGDATDPEGLSGEQPPFLQLGTERDWMYRLQGP